MKIVILGLSITSSWGNGHATTYRGVVRELAARGHDVIFLERDQPWYADNRDAPQPEGVRLGLYRSLHELHGKARSEVAGADAVIVGSFVPEGVAVAEWVLEHARGVTAFYDIDTPVTLQAIAQESCEYLTTELVARFDLYLSFTGGPTLRRIEREFGARRARALFCSVDATQYHPEPRRARWDLGYLGTFSEDRQPMLERLLVAPAQRWPEGRFIIAGPQYPRGIAWPPNVRRVQHLSPDRHRRFYNEQRFTLNVTRASMVAAGYSPSVRLFEAAACGTPIISDYWPGLEELFLPGEEVLLGRTSGEVLAYLRELSPERAREIGAAARARVLAGHTAAHRAAELEEHLTEAASGEAVEAQSCGARQAATGQGLNKTAPRQEAEAEASGASGGIRGEEMS